MIGRRCGRSQIAVEIDDASARECECATCRRGIINASGDVESRTRVRTDRGVEVHRDGARDGIAARNALQLAAKVDAAEENIVHSLEVDGIGKSQASRELEGRTRGASRWRD